MIELLSQYTSCYSWYANTIAQSAKIHEKLKNYSLTKPQTILPASFHLYFLIKNIMETKDKYDFCLIQHDFKFSKDAWGDVRVFKNEN